MAEAGHIPPTPRSRSIPERGAGFGRGRLPANAFASARRASVTLMVFAAVALLLGLFFSVLPVNGSFITTAQLLNAVIICVLGIVFGVLGLLVRAGTRPASVAAIVVSGLACIYVAAAGIYLGLNFKNLNVGAAPLVFLVAALGTLVVQIVWLVEAAAIAPHIAAMRRRPEPPAADARPKP